MQNPFDDEDGTFVVLMNDQGQYSLWPVIADVPAGWQVVFERDTREACTRFIDENWTDMRPRELVEFENGNRS